MRKFNISNYIKENRTEEVMTKGILCKDGFKISIQASKYHYCSPRENEGPWTTVECGYPSKKVKELMKWAEEPKNPTGTVYPYVPVEVVEGVIEAHGGVKEVTTE